MQTLSQKEILTWLSENKELFYKQFGIVRIGIPWFFCS